MGKDYCMESIVRLIVAIGLGYSCNRGYYTFLHEDGKIVYNLGKFFVGEEAGCLGLFLFVHVGWDIASRE